MSKAYKCDRCGEVFGKRDRTAGYHTATKIRFKSIDLKDASHSDYDLCPNCSVELSNWMNDKK